MCEGLDGENAAKTHQGVLLGVRGSPRKGLASGPFDLDRMEAVGSHLKRAAWGGV